MKVETIANDKFTILTVDGAPVQVRALPMSDAVAWAALATKATAAVATADDYGAMRDAMNDCAEVLGQYPGIDGTLLDKCSTEQISGALEALLEVNDPFAQRRRRAEAEAIKRQARELEIIKALPADAMKMILEQNSDALSVPLQSSST